MTMRRDLIDLNLLYGSLFGSLEGPTAMWRNRTVSSPAFFFYKILYLFI